MYQLRNSLFSAGKLCRTYELDFFLHTLLHRNSLYFDESSQECIAGTPLDRPAYAQCQPDGMQPDLLIIFFISS